MEIELPEAQESFNNTLIECLDEYTRETLPDVLTIPLSVAFSVIEYDSNDR